MTIFVLMRHVECEFGEPLGVYSTRELAESEKKRAQEWCDWNPYKLDKIEIEEITLDRTLEIINNILQ